MSYLSVLDSELYRNKCSLLCQLGVRQFQAPNSYKAFFLSHLKKYIRSIEKEWSNQFLLLLIVLIIYQT